jgi:acyl-coenzyme A synthetase/AMP-(fatty) acid ligase
MGRRKGPRNLGLLFERFATAGRPVFHLDRPFDIAPGSGTSFTAGEMARLVAEMSGALHEAGLRKGDRIGIIKDNHFDVVVLAAAAARIGALPAMISATIRPEALRAMLVRLEPRVLVAAPPVLAAAARAGVELAGPAATVVTVAGADGEVTVPGTVALADLRGAPVPDADPVADDEPMICTHTSGTTGVPKLVVHSADTAIKVNSRLETTRIPFLSTRKNDVVVACVAWVHIRSVTWLAGQLLLPPGEAVILAGSDPETVVATLREHRPTTLEACPNIFQRWEGLPASHPELFERVRAYVSTFDAIHPRTVRTFLEASPRRGVVWGQSWGQSEVGPVSLGVYTRRRMRRTTGAATAATTNAGRPVPVITKVRIVDPETRRRVRHGRQGIVLVRTKGCCLDYLGESDRHRAKIWDGWWNTGDIGERTWGGGLRILDREVDLIPGVSGIDLESVLLERLPAASEIIVLGVPGRPPVPVLGMDGQRPDPAAWRAATADLPELGEPMLIGWEEFPRTGTWKVRRPELREHLFGSKVAHGTGRWT